MNERKIGTCLFLSILFLAAACTSNEDLAKERARRAQAAQGNIRIAVVWQRKLAQTYFFQGTELAINEINRGGGINGRKLDSQRYFNDTAEVENDRHIAKSIAADEDMVAVVGHYTSEGAIAASVTYEFSGLLYISPAATNVGVSRHGFQFVFRNTLSDEVNGAQLAEFSKRRGYLRMAVIDDRMVYGKGLADIFHERASKIGIDVVARRSYDSMGKDFKPLFADIKHLQFDAIFLGGSMPTAAEVIKQARIMGVMEPFLGGDSLNVPNLWQIAGSAAEGTITPTVFHHDESDASSREFNASFFKNFGVYPDTWAALGYDAIQLLAETFRQTGTTVPIVAASHLRFLEERTGILGTYSFMKNGDISGNINRFQILHNGRYELLEDTAP